MDKRRKFTEEQEILIASEYLNNKSFLCSFLAKKYNTTEWTIRRVLKRRGVQLRNGRIGVNKKYSVNDNFFEKIDTEEKAYFLGLLYADGYNNQKANLCIIELQEEDKEILDKFKEKIKYTGPLYFQKPKKTNWKNMYRLSVKSRKMSEDLYNLGCVQKKSLILEFPTEKQVPKRFLKHFIRGMIDGDGSILCGHGKGKATGVSLVSTGALLSSLEKVLINKLGIKPIIRNQSYNNITKELRLTKKKEIETFLDWIYKDAKIYLKRKYEQYKKAKKIFRLTNKNRYKITSPNGEIFLIKNTELKAFCRRNNLSYDCVRNLFRRNQKSYIGWTGDYNV